uniref:Uncharacterized protein n=1 Tax=Opuntia streptacantha TaxID=393608 RepID=A0A7C9E2P1_OPUST
MLVPPSSPFPLRLLNDPGPSCVAHGSTPGASLDNSSGSHVFLSSSSFSNCRSLSILNVFSAGSVASAFIGLVADKGTSAVPTTTLETEMDSLKATVCSGPELPLGTLIGTLASKCSLIVVK